MDYLTLTLEGDHYTQGWQHGRQVQSLRPQIARAIAAQVQREDQFAQAERGGAPAGAPAGGYARFERLLQETRDLLQEIDAPLLDLIRGQAEALEFEFDTLLRYSLGIYLCDAMHGDVTRQPCAAEGCTTWAATGSATVAGADGTSGPLLAKSRDYRPEHLSLQVVIQVTPQVGLSLRLQRQRRLPWRVLRRDQPGGAGRGRHPRHVHRPGTRPAGLFADDAPPGGA